MRLEPWTGAAPVRDPAAARAVAQLTEHPRPHPWGCYLAHDGGVNVGVCAFKGAPDADGTVEIAYLTPAEFERRGWATAMVAALIEIARDGGARIVIAHTLPGTGASAQVLLRNGFEHADAFDDPDDGWVWYWERVL